MTRPPRGVPRDEWLLAVGLANAGARRHANYLQHGLIHWVAAWVKDAPLVCREDGEWVRDNDSDELAAMLGAWSHVRSDIDAWPYNRDAGNPGAYAAGAALAMALEGS